MNRILICGSNGLLGQRLAQMLSRKTEFEVLNTSHHRNFVLDHQLFDYTQLDITKKGDVRSLIASFQPTVILNAAATTNVDWCETHREHAWNVNVVGIENLIDAAKRVGARIVHVSTDYVFDGKEGPYAEDDRPNPISYYGKTKLAGENAIRISGVPHSIVRTIVLYGYGINVKSNFALWVIESLRAGKSIRCVEDQISNPTHVNDLALAIVRIFQRQREGIYHLSGSETVSRYDFAMKIAEVFRLERSHIQRIKSSELQQAAPRPMVTGFITLKAETELGLRTMNILEGLTLLKREMESAGRN